MQSPKILNRDVFEIIADAFASRSGEGWEQSDETQLYMRPQGEIYPGYYRPGEGDVHEQSWIEFYPSQGAPREVFHFRNLSDGTIAMIKYDPDIAEEVALHPSQQQKRAILQQIQTGLAITPPHSEL